MQRLVATWLAAFSYASLATPTPLPRGQVTERVACRADSSQTYALYLPSAYTPERTWPVLLVMDPRGRAMRGLELFRAPAERLGWVIASSYDTRSDESLEPNERALGAMLPDLAERIAIHPQRLYLTGFSGTSRIAWAVAHDLDAAVAGVIGVGGGMTGGLAPKAEMTFAYFGAAGTSDFNFQEMRELEATMAKVGARHRFVYFDGRHSWPPESVCAEALEWLELDAIRRELRPVDADWVLGQLDGRRRAADELERGGQLCEAERAHAAIGRDFAGLADVSSSIERSTALIGNREVRATRSRLAKAAKAERAFRARFTSELGRLVAGLPPPPSVSRVIRKLRLGKLRQRAAGDDELDAQSARRQLEYAFAHAGFYVPRQLLVDERYGAAIAVLEIARFIRPESARVAFFQAQAEAGRGRDDAALAALERAVDGGFRDRGAVTSEPRFERVRETAGYRNLLERLP